MYQDSFVLIQKLIDVAESFSAVCEGMMESATQVHGAAMFQGDGRGQTSAAGHQAVGVDDLFRER